MNITFSSVQELKLMNITFSSVQELKLMNITFSSVQELKLMHTGSGKFSQVINYTPKYSSAPCVTQALPG